MGTFNDYVDIILLPFFDHVLTSKWTFLTLNMDKNRNFLDHLPISPCQRSNWTSPFQDSSNFTRTMKHLTTNTFAKNILRIRIYSENKQILRTVQYAITCYISLTLIPSTNLSYSSSTLSSVSSKAGKTWQQHPSLKLRT